MSEESIEIAAAPERVLAAVAEAAELWGASWRVEGRGGEVELPVSAGLRRGAVRARLSLEKDGSGTRATLEIRESRYTLNRTAVVVLAFGAAGGLTLVFWPFFPRLARLAPVAAVLAVVAWLLVVSRLRSAGPRDFLELVADLASGEKEDPVRPPGIEPGR